MIMNFRFAMLFDFCLLGLLAGWLFGRGTAQEQILPRRIS